MQAKDIRGFFIKSLDKDNEVFLVEAFF